MRVQLQAGESCGETTEETENPVWSHLSKLKCSECAQRVDKWGSVLYCEDLLLLSHYSRAPTNEPHCQLICQIFHFLWIDLSIKCVKIMKNSWLTWILSDQQPKSRRHSVYFYVTKKRIKSSCLRSRNQQMFGIVVQKLYAVIYLTIFIEQCITSNHQSCRGHVYVLSLQTKSKYFVPGLLGINQRLQESLQIL